MVRASEPRLGSASDQAGEAHHRERASLGGIERKTHCSRGPLDSQVKPNTLVEVK